MLLFGHVLWFLRTLVLVLLELGAFSVRLIAAKIPASIFHMHRPFVFNYIKLCSEFSEIV